LCRKTVEFAGFGISTTGRITRLMETVEMTIISKRECENRVERLNRNTYAINEKYLCAVADPIALMSNVCTTYLLFEHFRKILLK
jgi:hypothetical protein